MRRNIALNRASPRRLLYVGSPPICTRKLDCSANASSRQRNAFSLSPIRKYNSSYEET
jgi:hypothetical protein